MKKYLIISAVSLLLLFIAVCQLSIAIVKYEIFFTHFNQELWASTMGDSAFIKSYLFSVIVFAVFVLSLVWKLNANKTYLYTIRIVLLISTLISIFASVWFFDMHNKHMLVGYQERLEHIRQVN